MKNKNAAASYLTCLAGVLALVAVILYGNVMYKYSPVYAMLIGAVVLAVLGFFLAPKFPKIANYVPVCMSVLLASAGVWGSQLMINQIAYVVSGLDPISTIMSWIWFLGFTLAALILCLIASFRPMAKRA